MSDTESEYEDEDGYECCDEMYCRDCVHVVVKEDAKTMTFNELCNCDTHISSIYLWLYDYDSNEETLCESVSIIENWWLIQRKKMLKKPTKSANKTQH